MKNELFSFCDQLLAVAVNGVCQGIFLALLVWVSLRVIGRTNAATRHAVWFLTLLLAVLILAGHCSYLAFGPDPIPASARPNILELAPRWASSASGPAEIAELRRDVSSPETALVLGDTAIPNEVPSLGTLGASPRAKGSHEDTTAKAQDHPLVQTVLAAFSLQDPYIRAALAASDEPPELSPLQRLSQWLTNPMSIHLGSRLPKSAGLLIVAGWMALVAVRLSVLLVRLARIRKLKHGSVAPSVELSRLFHDLCAGLSLNRTVELKVSPLQRSAMVLGFVHPVILIPAGEPVEEAEQVLRHELAHVCRRDDWANLIQHFIQAFLFFHPAAWWIANRLALEREIACDDHVLKQSGRPRAYALLLANLAERMQSRAVSLAPGASTNKSQLQQRIDMILDTKRNTSPRLSKGTLAWMTLGAALVAVGAVSGAPRVVLAPGEPLAELPAVAGINDAEAAPAAPSATIQQSFPSSSGVGQAPKITSGDLKPHPFASHEGATVPRVAATPAEPAIPAAATIAGTPPLPLIAAEPFSAAPVPGRSQMKRAEAALEQRLERVERMLESLVNQPSQTTSHPGFRLKTPDAWIGSSSQGSTDLKANDAKESARRAAMSAIEAAGEVEREAHDAAKAQFHHPPRSREAFQKELQALREQLDSIEREKQRIREQIQRLEQKSSEVEKGDSDLERQATSEN